MRFWKLGLRARASRYKLGKASKIIDVVHRKLCSVTVQYGKCQIKGQLHFGKFCLRENVNER